jgi:thiol:disulfide interchange protein DsbD
MKKLLFTLIAFLVFTNGFSQILDPVKWKSKTEKISETEFNLILEGKIDAGWHLYSQFTPDGGPIPLGIQYEEKTLCPHDGIYNVICSCGLCHIRTH